jgi:hypothetical protein
MSGRYDPQDDGHDDNQPEQRGQAHRGGGPQSRITPELADRRLAMRHSVSVSALGHATSLFLAVTFAACVAFDLLFPAHAVYQSWHWLLPGFGWISWRSFLLGLAESYGYGWYIALIWAPLYNVLAARADRAHAAGNPAPAGRG